MKKILIMSLLAGGVLLPGGSVALADCEPEPQCCPTNPQCWVPELEAIRIDNLCEAVGLCDPDDVVSRILHGGS